MGSSLDFAIGQLADALGTAAGTSTLGDGSYLLPQESVDGPGAATFRQNRMMYIRDEFGTRGLAVLAQDAGIPYAENAAIAQAGYTVDLERKNNTLYIKRINLTTQRQLGGETLTEQKMNASTFTNRKQIDICRIQVVSGSSVIQTSDIFSFEDPTSGLTRMVVQPSLDLTDTIAALAAGEHQLAIPYLDPTTAQLEVLLSTADTATGDLPDRDAFGLGEILELFQSLPLGGMESFPIYLYADQSPVEADIYRDYDLRPLCQPLSRAITPLLTTTNATATTLVRVPVAEGTAVTVSGFVTGMKEDASAAFGAFYRVTVRREDGGDVTIVGTGTVDAEHDSGTGTPALTFAEDTASQELWGQVAGVAAETWYWRADEQRVRVVLS